ncbi:hypothetical protein [Geomicrobium sp. JCM 19055]|uniref:hypothetical protein n=1 Tax=Geomicrobium sp. JCM 19055 TaxID=1460649 RepID=UPI00045ED303|nr:hypothetical protein [Geomicrobium sp. JCM 19055]GAJ99970.1 hypothetical protein JCM19055_3033 [Geomicrobium sp. JCM 19055]
MNVIEVYWDGPFTFEQVKQLGDERTDYGLYQIYGNHVTYGSDVLLYIGQANNQTFRTRLGQHNDKYVIMNDSAHTKIYIGRIGGEHQIDNNVWYEQIKNAERLLIHVHKPAFNSQFITDRTRNELDRIHILNWGNRRHLLPEVSSVRWGIESNNGFGSTIYEYEE